MKLRALQMRGRSLGCLAAAALLAACAMPPQQPAQTQTPPGSTETQRFQWAGGTAIVGRMPNGSSRIAFGPAVGVDLGQAGTVVIERADPVLGGAMFVVRAATPGCEQGHRVFRVVDGHASGWLLGGCNAPVTVVRADQSGWAAVQDDGPVVRSYLFGGNGTLDVHVAPNVMLQPKTPAKKTVARTAKPSAAPRASQSPASRKAVPAAGASDVASSGGAASGMLPSKLAAGTPASGAGGTPVVVDLGNGH